MPFTLFIIQSNHFCRYQAIHSNHTALISSDPEKFRSLVIFGTDLYLRFLGPADVSDTEESEEVEPKPETRKRQPVLADLLYQLYRSALTIGKEDTMNLTTVVDMLKLSGGILEEDEKEAADENNKQLQNLMDAIYLMSKVSASDLYLLKSILHVLRHLVDTLYDAIVLFSFRMKPMAVNIRQTFANPWPS